MKKPGKKRVEQLADNVSFATSWVEVDDGIVENTYLAPLLEAVKNAEAAFESALETEMERHNVEYS